MVWLALALFLFIMWMFQCKGQVLQARSRILELEKENDKLKKQLEKGSPRGSSAAPAPASVAPAQPGFTVFYKEGGKERAYFVPGAKTEEEAIRAAAKSGHCRFDAILRIVQS